MGTNNKYYTPELEEFCPGFECEFKSYINGQEQWEKRVINIDSFQLDSYEDITYKSNWRVKYLDKQDIEEVLGVKQLKGDDINLNFQILLDDSEDFYEINYDLDSKILTIEFFKEDEDGDYDTYPLFSYGIIKNKTEFKTIKNKWKQLKNIGNT